MNKSKKHVTLLFPPRGHIYQYSLYPFLRSKICEQIRFTQSADWVLQQDTNEVLILFGWFKFHTHLKNDDWLTRLRNKYRVLVYFDDNDGSEILYLDTLKYFDLYFKKQVFADRSLYTQPLLGNRVFTDYYCRRFGIADEQPKGSFPMPEDASHIKRIRVAWNLALGEYPLSNLKSKLSHVAFKTAGVTALRQLQRPFPETAAPGLPPLQKCHARFGFGKYRYTVGYQRKLFLETVQGQDEFLSGMVPKKQYDSEMRNVQAVLSPFGWGEICYRDIEAILNGAVLVKPSMEHLETWPELYRPDDTYVPVKWDASDVVDKVVHLLGDTARMDHLREQAWDTLKQAYANCAKRAEDVFEEIRDTKSTR